MMIKNDLKRINLYPYTYMLKLALPFKGVLRQDEMFNYYKIPAKYKNLKFMSLWRICLIWSIWLGSTCTLKYTNYVINYLFKMNSASLATLTIWSFIACESNRPSLINSIKAKPACFCKEFCHSWEHNNITNST